MFGLKKRIWMSQLRRAVTIENCLKTGIFERQVESHGYDARDNKPSDEELAVFGNAVNHILTWNIDKQVQMLGGGPDAAEKIHSLAGEILASDPNLERLVVRVLYEIASLGHLLEREEWARKFLQDHPRIMDVLAVARTKHPDLFRDVEETEFKALFDRFIDEYLPDMKQTSAGMFG